MVPFFLGGGDWKAPDSGGGGMGGSRGGVSCEKFGVDNRGGGGGVDVVHNQGVWGRGVHGLVMMVHKSLMCDSRLGRYTQSCRPSDAGEGITFCVSRELPMPRLPLSMPWLPLMRLSPPRRPTSCHSRDVSGRAQYRTCNALSRSDCSRALSSVRPTTSVRKPVDSAFA